VTPADVEPPTARRQGLARGRVWMSEDLDAAGSETEGAFLGEGEALHT
jgi:hypothetical protein